MSKSSGNRKMRRLTGQAKNKGKRPVQRRMCGTCTACCTAMAVVNDAQPGMIRMDKRGGVACEYCDGESCTIYEKRPLGCRDYACAWALNILGLSEGMRPDKIECVIDVLPGAVKEMTDKGEVARYVPDMVHIRPMHPDALTQLPLLMERLAKEHTCVVMFGETVVGLMQYKENHLVGDSTKKAET